MHLKLYAMAIDSPQLMPMYCIKSLVTVAVVPWGMAPITPVFGKRMGK
jgi:hypothetical protein